MTLLGLDMEFRISAEDWKSTEMIRAENALFDAVDRAGKVLEDVERRMAEMEADDRPEGGQVAAMMEFASGPLAPAELREAIEQVNFGQLTREQALADPRIAGNPLLMAALEAATRTSEPEGAGEPEARPRWRRAVTRPDYDEEDFSTHTIMR